MKDSGGGAIVMIATMVEHKPLATQGGYGSSKSALRCATKHLALELGKYSIRVNSCHMGWMWGPTVEGYFAWQARRPAKPGGADRRGHAQYSAGGDSRRW